jgi:hypothetical protein
MNARDEQHRQIRRALAVFCEPGDVIELRVPNAVRAGTRSGYYDDPEALTRDAVRLDAPGELPGIYITPNPVNPALLARAVNRAITHAKHTTADGDIIARRWLLVDLDPVRPAGVSSTDAEHAAALTLAREARDWLAKLGVPLNSMVLADSGNGAHLLVRIELPNDASATELCKRCLAALDLHLSTDDVHVDTTTSNAARIWKLYGTTARKGDPTQDRPHRCAGLLEVPATVVVAPRDALERLAALLPVEPERDHGAPRTGRRALDVGVWLADHGIEVASEAPWNGGRKWILAECPFAVADHGRDRAAFVVQFASGAIFARCHHARCQGWGRRELRERYEPGRTRREPLRITRAEQDPPGDDTEARGRRARLVCVADVAAEAIEWLWLSRLARGKLTLLAGDPGVGKTYLALAITAGLTRGWALPGEAVGREPCSIVYLSREDGVGDTLRPRLDALGADVQRVHVLTGADDSESVSLSDVDVIGDAIESRRAGLVVVDPVQSWLGARVDAHRANETRPVLDAMGAVCARHRCACLIIAHTAKARGMRAVTAALGSIDFAGAARVMLIAGADPQDDNRSILAAAKTNIGPMPGSIAYSVDRVTGAFGWLGAVDLTAADVLAADTATGDDRSALTEAAAWLRQELASGARAASEMERAARAARIADHTLRRARRSLGVRVRRQGFGPGGKWVWELPSDRIDGDPTPIDAIDGIDARTQAVGTYDAYAADGRARPAHSDGCGCENCTPPAREVVEL